MHQFKELYWGDNFQTFIPANGDLWKNVTKWVYTHEHPPLQHCSQWSRHGEKKHMRKTQVYVNRWMDKENMIHNTQHRSI